MTMNAIAIAIGAGPFVGGSPSPQFAISLADAGAGAINLTPWIGTGAATFTRATVATCWDANGLLLTVATGVARSTYTELVGGTYLGFLSEEARTNTCIQNRDFTNAAWVKTTMTAAKDQVGIDGTANSASSLLATGANATAAQTVTIAAVNRPFSVYVKRLVGTGNIDLAQDGAAFTTQSVANDGLWHRVTLVASQLNPVLTIRLATNADKIAVDYAMLDDSGGAARTFPLSPIATVAAAVTRNVDVLTFQAAGNILGAAGTVAYDATIPDVDAATTRGAWGTGAGNNRATANAIVSGSAFPRFQYGTGAAVVSAISTLAVTPNATIRTVDRWSTDGAIFANGANKVTNATAPVITPGATIDVGQGSAVPLNGAIKNFRVWQIALPDSQIASL